MTQPPPPARPPQPSQPPPPSQAPASIEVTNVSKWFGDVVAVSDVSFVVRPGLTALLGPNGAGKSTMLRMLCGLTPPSQGTVSVLGGNPRDDREITRHIGLVPQQESVFEVQTALQFVRMAGELQEVDDPEAAARHWLEVVELDPDDERLLTTYSKGMRQRVRLAQAVIHNPHVLFLDEPLTGLDPRQRLHMVSLFKQLGDEGHCVLVSSHVLEEVERLGSRVLVIAQGRLAAQGDFHAIRNLMDDRPHRFAIQVDNPRGVGGALLASGTVSGVELTGPDRLTIETVDVAAFRRTVALAAQHQQTRLRELTPLDEDLESVFRYLVGTQA